MSSLYQQFFAIIREIPSGKVASYSQVSKLAGLHNGARLVGWALGTLPENTTVPWQRVINSKGYLSIRNPEFSVDRQRDLLEKEGITFKEKDGLYYINGDFWMIEK